MKHNSKALIVLLLLFVSANGFAQAGHALQVDDGTSYSLIIGSTPGGTYTLPPGGGTLMVSNSGTWLLGGNTNPSSSILGTLTGQNLDLWTNNASRLMILSGGNVGVGEANPAALLSVGSGSPFQVNGSGNMSTSGTVTIGSSGTPITEVKIYEIVAGPYTVLQGGDLFLTFTGGAISGLDLRDQVTVTWDDAAFANNQCIWSAHVVAANSVRVNIHSFGIGNSTIPLGTTNRITVTRFN